jgi:conjugal transfer pilus assembly protein TraK
VLQQTDVPSYSIVIKQPKAKPRPLPTEFKSQPYDKSVKRLITAMANDAVPGDMEIKDVGQSLALWKEASMTLEREYRAEGMIGERYRIVNISKEPMVLDEREFYRKGVSVVAIEQLNLVPGGATRVFVLREKAAHE